MCVISLSLQKSISGLSEKIQGIHNELTTSQEHSHMKTRIEDKKRLQEQIEKLQEQSNSEVYSYIIDLIPMDVFAR